MIKTEIINRLEDRLARLIGGVLAKKESQINFLVGLNQLDDILISLHEGQPVIDDLTRFLSRHRVWLEDGSLDNSQRKRLGVFLSSLNQELLDRDDTDHFKLVEEIREWSQRLGTGSLKLTFKSSGEQASLADRFYSLLRRESEEMNMLLTERGHLLTCLDDILSSAESKNDKMYQHLAASLIYFLKLEGYKADPYIKRLRRLKEDK
jgi:hypothetical protein